MSVLKAEERTLPGFEETDKSGKWQQPFFFVQAADTQLGKQDYCKVFWHRTLCALKNHITMQMIFGG